MSGGGQGWDGGPTWVGTTGVGVTGCPPWEVYWRDLGRATLPAEPPGEVTLQHRAGTGGWY